MKKASLLLMAAALMPAFAQANQAGDIIVRAGTATLRPNEGSDNVLGSLGSFNVDNNTQLGLTFTYMATDNIGVELLAATPFQHKVGLNGMGTIAEVKHLPPTLMAQYYFGQKEDKLRPYLGVGVNYTTFFDEKFNDTGTNAGLSDLSFTDSWGIAAQAGLDYNLNKNWLLNMSLWWMDISTDVKFKSGGQDQTVSTRLDPWLFMFAVGYKF
ncbi:outer membrane protein OmpW [Pectobacteriaceae bacterium CE70]|uniref:Outer membrane protein W n=1 Tax=Serratia sp. (strain ATCC 39006) TaxID=104623 RepID=A0A2I5TKM8_SERS3|nr:outer membrane protein OmpW [Serratia sp. ATCC 39006]WJV64512.1 outer membrane protein OmpW [Pectobacteriaceae bacterium C52]WJV65050.1 outer membrane protein OmpW [Pectobacteriaceae bacterium CE70]WJY09069.1 outer membrane protein OmpW [Pectobacteriaceae bacterium C80]AUH00799.1 outer membrane protein OmpW [Serratia sp. ATCC 39006]AUH05120.1 outer membrane protein OmpW [Serratia sp. ATCC 39006]